MSETVLTGHIEGTPEEDLVGLCQEDMKEEFL